VLSFWKEDCPVVKIKVDKNLFCLPWTQTILGSHINGRVNFMALDWLTRVNYQPAMLGICVNKGHATNVAIRATGEYSINVPSVDMVAVTDYCGVVSGKNTDKSKLFEVFYGELKDAPMISACPLTLECKLTQIVDLPTNTFFISEIRNIYSEEKFMQDGKPDPKKIRPFMLTMPDNRFWSLGEQVGNAWKDGVKFKENIK
jgi:flavin reductase (DIM6/NTAB) family NADH-FMN oxidoreductase RutF